MPATHELSLPHPEGSQSEAGRVSKLLLLPQGAGSAVSGLRRVVLRLNSRALNSPTFLHLLCTSFPFSSLGISGTEEAFCMEQTAQGEAGPTGSG